MIWAKIWVPQNANLSQHDPCFMAQDKFWKFAAKKLAEENIEIEDLPAAASQAADDYFLEIQETGAD